MRRKKTPLPSGKFARQSLHSRGTVTPNIVPMGNSRCITPGAHIQDSRSKYRSLLNSSARCCVLHLRAFRSTLHPPHRWLTAFHDSWTFILKKNVVQHYTVAFCTCVCTAVLYRTSFILLYNSCSCVYFYPREQIAQGLLGALRYRCVYLRAIIVHVLCLQIWNNFTT